VGDFTGKVGQIDIVFDVRLEFVSRSVHARLQVSVCRVTICATLVKIQTHTHRQHFDQLISKAQPAELKIKRCWHKQSIQIKSNEL